MLVTEKIAMILASNSPRRKELLALGGWAFETRPADVDETALVGEPPTDYVLRVAMDKAQKVGAEVEADSLVVAADTIVALDGEILGKPADADEARTVLKRLRGREHMAYSGLAVVRSSDGALFSDLASSVVPCASIAMRR
jgi:MAF protein